MKIAIINGLWLKVPPKGYGGTQRIVYELVEGLVKNNHEVTLFAAGTSKTSAKLVAVYPRPLISDKISWTNLTYPLLNITKAIEMEKKFDILHFHIDKSSDFMALPLSLPIAHKVLFTLHFPYPLYHSKENKRYDQHLVLQKYKNLYYTSISNAARYKGENLNWQATIYNGIDISKYTFNPKPKDYFVWIGKFNHEKGTKEAIYAAKRAKVQLILGGKIDKFDSLDKDYFFREIKPLIDNKQIKYIGEVSGKDKDKLYGQATAFLNPILWNEPFGLVMIESQATGTPVISFGNGAAGEVIKDRITGYLVNGVKDMASKIKIVHKLERIKARENVEKHFQSNTMVQGYEKVYQKILSKN